MDLFKLLGTISINNSDAVDALDETSVKGQETESKLSKAFGAVGKGALAVGKAVGTGLLAGGAAMGALTVKAMNLSGELEQNMGGSEAVFAEYAGKMQETAKNAFENMGLSTSDFLGTANKMGALFQGAGFSIEESSNLASDSMQRAADVASIMGIDTASAMEAIAGAAKGNFTMMDNLGVAMNDTTLNAYALEKGINKTTQEMTNQEKIALAMEMFMEKTSYAAGNYAKENETLAGSLGTAKSALTNFLDGSGDVDQLVGAFSNAANVIVKNIKEIAPRLISGITDIIKQVIPMLPPLLQELLPTIIDGAVSLINGLVDALPTILDALMSALPSLIEGVQQIINALIQALPQIIRSLVSALPTLIPMLVDGLVSMIVTLCEVLPDIIQPIIDYLPDIIISLVDALIKNLPMLIEGLITLVLGIVEALPVIIQGIVDATPKIVEMVVTGLLENIPMLIQGAIQLVAGVVKALPQILASLLQALPNAMKGIWNAVKNVFSGVGGFFGGKFTEGFKSIKEAFSKVGDFFRDIWTNIKKPFSSVTDWFKEKFSNAWQAVKDVFSTGGKVFDGIKDGIANVFTTVVNKIIGGINKVIAVPFNAINGVLQRIKDVEIANIKPFDWITTFSVPEIPLLEWNARAMKNPRIFDKPTIYGYNPGTGTYQGVGEVGSEVVSGTGVLMDMISSAVATQNAALVAILTKILDAIMTMDENMGGHMRDALDGVSFDLNKREFARLVKETI